MRILVVEDNVILALCVSNTLVDAGHEVIGPAKTAAEGLHLAQLTRPDLALLNIDLGSEAKGTHLAWMLSSLFRTPVLFVSGDKDEAWAARNTALGYIAKPCTSATLLKSVELAEALAGGAAPEGLHIPHGLTLFHMSPETSS